VKGLARHLGRLDDYVQLYAPISNMNVHAADPETHLNIAADGTVDDQGAPHDRAGPCRHHTQLAGRPAAGVPHAIPR